MQFMMRELSTRREKALTTLTKVLLDLLDYQPEAYMSFIQTTLQLSVQYTFTPELQGKYTCNYNAVN